MWQVHLVQGKVQHPGQQRIASRHHEFRQRLHRGARRWCWRGVDRNQDPAVRRERSQVELVLLHRDLQLPRLLPALDRVLNGGNPVPLAVDLALQFFDQPELGTFLVLAVRVQPGQPAPEGEGSPS